MKYIDGEQKDNLVVSEMIPNTDPFELMQQQDIISLSNFDERTLFNGIQDLWIEKCSKLSTIVTSDVDLNSIMQHLVQIYLEDLISLRCAFRGPLNTETLFMLHILSFNKCLVLTEVFSKGALKHFSELKKLKIEDC